MSADAKPKAASVSISVLGTLEVALAGDRVVIGAQQQRLVLAYLASRPGTTVTTDALIDVIWPAEPPSTARKTIQVYVSSLRKVLGGEEAPIISVPKGYVLSQDRAEVDAERFDALIGEAGESIPRDPARAVDLLRKALALWRGTPYAELEADPLIPEITRLNEARLVAVEARIDCELALGRHAELVGELGALTLDHPYREHLQAQHMLALYRSGRQADALRAYGRTKTILAEGLGIDPSAELQDLEEQILLQSPELDLLPVEPVTNSSDATVHGIRGYELRERLGEGDYGIVYRGYQASIGREVAIKVIRPQYANRPSFVRRFEQEARLVAQLEHPHIVSLFDFWRDPTGAYLVMPWLRGGNLTRSLERGAWRPPAAMRLLDQVGEALAHAHRHGVIHRDVKPENVLLDSDGNAYLSDFGVAARHAEASGGPLTTSPAYISPEEAAGAETGSTSDVYALGMLSHHLLTGTEPGLDGMRGRVATQRPDVPVAVDHVLDVATGTDPAQRYARVEDFLRAMRQALGIDVVAPDHAEPATPLRNPYKGLRAFQERDALDFFGRQTEVAQLEKMVSTNRLVSVVGPSGSGKSSLVKAGLIPALRQSDEDSWLITEMYPGSYPFEELEAALRRVSVEALPGLAGELRSDGRGLLRSSKQLLPDDDSRLLIVIDQFEELFSLTADEDTRSVFLDNLTVVASDTRSRVTIVVTMRADFFDRPLEYPEFGALMQAALLPIAMPLEESLALAISTPARNAGLELEPGLITEVVRDVANQPGGLPLLQHAMSELFERRHGRTLSIETYRESGGVTGALSRRAEEIYSGLGDAPQAAARHVFLRMVRADEENDDTRRRVRRTELDSLGLDDHAVDAVLQAFGGFRLLSFDRDPLTRGPTVEVAHEALISNWERLATWVDERRADLILERRLAGAVDEWRASGEDDAYLLRGGRLAQFEELASSGDIRLTTPELELIDSSGAAERADEEGSRRRRRLLTQIWAAVSVIGLALTIFAFVSRMQATEQRDLAQSHSALATARELTLEAEKAVDVDPELSLHLGLAAIDAYQAAGVDPWPATTVIHSAIAANRVRGRVPGSSFVTTSRDGRFMAAELDGEVAVYDLATMELVQIVSTYGAQPRQAELSPSGDRLAVMVEGDVASVTIVDLSDGSSFLITPEYGTNVQARRADSVQFSPDGTLLAIQTWSEEGVHVWSLPERRSIYVSHEFGLSPTFSPDGAIAFAYVEDAAIDHILGSRFEPGPDTRQGVRIVDPVTGERIASIESDSPIGFVDWSPDARKLVVTSFSSFVVHDAATGDVLSQHDGFDQINDPEWLSDSRHLVVGGRGASAPRVIDSETGEVTLRLIGNRGGSGDVEAVDGSLLLVSASADGGTVVVFDASPLGGVEIGGWLAPLPTIRHGSFVGSGDEVFVSSWEDFVTASANTGFDVRPVVGVEVLDDFYPVMNETGLFAIHRPSEERWRIVTAATGDLLFEAPGNSRITAVNNNGTMALLQPDDGPAQVISIPSGETISTLRVSITHAVFSPDSSLIVATNDFGDTGIAETASGALVTFPDLVQDDGLPALTPDGQHLVVGGANGVISVIAMDQALQGSSLRNAIVLQIDAHDTEIVTLRVSPDGRQVISASAGESLKLWELETGTQLGQFGTGQLEGFAAKHDGDFHPTLPRLLVTTPPNQVRIHTLDLDALIGIAETHIHRQLTDEECRQYLHVENCSESTG